VYSIEFGKNDHLIGVKGGDSCGKSVSRCDPAGSVANEEAHRPPRGKRPPVTEINRISVFKTFLITSAFMKYESITNGPLNEEEIMSEKSKEH
jgi:hypothetical protein